MVFYKFKPGADKPYTIVRGQRGAGRLHHLFRTVGYDRLIAQGIRLRLKYLFWNEGDYYIARLRAFRDLSRGR
jgi:hypothetical protein